MGATRIAVLNSHPIQYFAPMYAYLCRDPGLEITALYCSDFSLRQGLDPGFGERITWDVDLLEGYRCVFLGPRAKSRNPAGFFSLVCPEVWSEVRSGKYDVLWLHGYAYAADLIAFLAAKTRGIPVFMRSETHLGLSRAPLRQRIRDAVLSVFYRFIDAFLAIGTPNANYYKALGVAADRIHLVPYTVDNHRFIEGARDDRATVRRRFGIADDEVVVLFASKLTPRKRAADLLRAAALLQSRGHRATVLLVGSGESKAELEALASELGLARAIFAGFVNQSSLPGILGAVDAFVLPSESEPWGLIVNEAMCAGLPVIVTDQVGAAGDLVTPRNGFVYGVGGIEALAKALEALVTDANKRRTMGLASLDIIRKWSYEQCREGLQSAIRTVCRA
ncbi:MAG TPA: glycosyltransferase [Usitatibacter sp.]